ncbi:hypothetical protein Gorai_011866, partial [Gossypium raimondii]|nr:hypothetical protein [Gossypium raimondii]
LRIARRNSLHKFFEKRKERATARAPYQVNNARGSTLPPKPDENKSSHEEGQSSKEASRDLDLKEPDRKQMTTSLNGFKIDESEKVP